MHYILLTIEALPYRILRGSTRSELPALTTTINRGFDSRFVRSQVRSSKSLSKYSNCIWSRSTKFNCKPINRYPFTTLFNRSRRFKNIHLLIFYIPIHYYFLLYYTKNLPYDGHAFVTTKPAFVRLTSLPEISMEIFIVFLNSITLERSYIIQSRWRTGISLLNKAKISNKFSHIRISLLNKAKTMIKFSLIFI